MIRFQCTKNGNVKLSAHSFRKYVQTNLDVAGVSPNIIDRILGHKLSYFYATLIANLVDEQLLEDTKTLTQIFRVYPDKVEIDQRISSLVNSNHGKNKVIANPITNESTKAANIEALLKRVIELEKN